MNNNDKEDNKLENKFKESSDDKNLESNMVDSGNEVDSQNTIYISGMEKEQEINEVEGNLNNSETREEPVVDNIESEYQDAIVEEMISDETEYIDSSKIEEELELRGVEEDLKEDSEEYEEESKGFLSRLLGCLGNMIFVLFIALMAFIIIINGISFLKGKEPTIFGYKMYVIGEDSMDPTLKRNDAIIVKEVDPRELEVGDLITYTSKNEKDTITGWVSEIYDNDRFEIKKKMNSDESVVINGIAVIGVATHRIANMGDFIDFISHPLGIGLVVIVGIIIYVIMWAISRNKNSKKYSTE
ncbi:MAG: hypothetical protein Q4P34_06910 [Tissierellia bacterium]|nr:hypothetical protein [Tissierellia bacterium]